MWQHNHWRNSHTQVKDRWTVMPVTALLCDREKAQTSWLGLLGEDKHVTPQTTGCCREQEREGSLISLSSAVSPIGKAFWKARGQVRTEFAVFRGQPPGRCWGQLGASLPKSMFSDITSISWKWRRCESSLPRNQQTLQSVVFFFLLVLLLITFQHSLSVSKAQRWMEKHWEGMWKGKWKLPSKAVAFCCMNQPPFT